MNINHDTQGNPACMGMSQTETGQRYLQRAPSAGSPGSSTRPVPYLALGWPQWPQCQLRGRGGRAATPPSKARTGSSALCTCTTCSPDARAQTKSPKRECQAHGAHNIWTEHSVLDSSNHSSCDGPSWRPKWQWAREWRLRSVLHSTPMHLNIPVTPRKGPKSMK